MITIAIKTDNDAFQGDRAGEVAAILRGLVARLDARLRLPENIRDSNGNHVGNVVVTGKDRGL